MSVKNIFLLLVAISCSIESVVGIEITYSGGDSGDLATIVHNYQVSNTVGINEQSYISFGPLNIDSLRNIYDIGDVNAALIYKGEDVISQNYVHPKDFSLSVPSYADLLPGDLGIQQIAGTSEGRISSGQPMGQVMAGSDGDYEPIYGTINTDQGILHWALMF